MKVKFHFDSGAYLVTEKIPLSGHITEHFTWEECANPSSGEDIILEIWPETLIHAQLREDFRNDWYARKGVGCVCNSNFRTKKYNQSVGGNVKSLHLWGCASDLLIGAPNDEDWKWCVDEVGKLGAKYGTQIELGRYDWGIHIGTHIEVWNKYTNQLVYTFDKRTKK